MTETGAADRDPHPTQGAGDPTCEKSATAAAEPIEDAVEQFLDQVGAETQAQQILHAPDLVLVCAVLLPQQAIEILAHARA